MSIIFNRKIYKKKSSLDVSAHSHWDLKTKKIYSFFFNCTFFDYEATLSYSRAKNNFEPSKSRTAPRQMEMKLKKQ